MEPFCRERSLAVDEPIAGSAVADTDRWIVLQYQPHWAGKAYAGAELPPLVRQHLDGALAAVPRSRLQLVRRPDHLPTAGLALYLVRVEPEGAETLAFRLSSYEALLGLDLAGLLQGTAAGPKPLRSRPLYLVCTHGTRDRCCARWGMPVYEALRDALGTELVWQSDHLGGHRFAANVLALPHGLAFGRLGPEDVPALVAARARGELPELRFYRGRCAYGPAQQAAEWFLLDDLERKDAESFRLVASELGEDGGWTCTFEDRHDGGQHTLAVSKRPLGELVVSCGAEPEPVSGFVRG
jgi:hypothetical protein